MTISPLVSVIVPIYGEEPYIRPSLESILNQTYENIEIILVIEQPANSTITQIPEAKEDVQIIRMATKGGLSHSLNQGIDASSGKYIARQDADDVSYSGRIETQVEYLESNSEVGLLGTASDQIDTEGNITATYNPPTHDHVLRWESLFSNPFIHSSTMFRRGLFESGCRYRGGDPFATAEDYDLWMQLAAVSKIENLSERLVQYRMHPGSLSQQKMEKQIDNFSALATRTIHQRCPSILVPQQVVKKIHTSIYRGANYGATGYRERCDISMHYLDILEAFEESVGTSEIVRVIAVKRILDTMGAPKSIRPGAIRKYIRLLSFIPKHPREIARTVLAQY